MVSIFLHGVSYFFPRTSTTAGIAAWAFILFLIGRSGEVSTAFMVVLFAGYFVVRLISVVFSAALLWQFSGNQRITLDRLAAKAGFDIVSQTKAALLSFGLLIASIFAARQSDSPIFATLAPIFFFGNSAIIPALCMPIFGVSDKSSVGWLDDIARFVMRRPLLAMRNIWTSRSASKPDYAAIAFLDLKGSTRAWDKDHKTMFEVLREFHQTVTAAKGENARIGNFTGDGYLLLYDTPSECIEGLARIIDAWEDVRTKYLATYNSTDTHFLSLRSGVHFGQYFPIRLGQNHVAGTSISIAQRIEAGSKEYFEKEDLFSAVPEADRPKPHQRIFISQGLTSGLKRDIHSSTEFTVELAGIYVPGRPGLESEWQKHAICAVWPKRGHRIQPQLMHNLTAADEAEKFYRLGLQMLENLHSMVGRTAQQAANAAIVHFQKSRDLYHGLKNPFLVAKCQTFIGHSLLILSVHHSPPVSEEKLDGSEKHFDEALKFFTAKDYPVAHASVWKSRILLSLLRTGADNIKKYTDAANAYSTLLETTAIETEPDTYAAIQAARGEVLFKHAMLLSGEMRRGKFQEATRAYNEALRGYASSPDDYAATQSSIASNFFMLATHLDGAEKGVSLTVAKSAIEEAIRFYKRDSSDYAKACRSLGEILLSQAYCVSGADRIPMLDAAAQSCRKALSVFTLKNGPCDYVGTLYNYGETLLLWNELRNEHLSLEEKARNLNDAVEAYRVGLRDIFPLNSTALEYAQYQCNLGLAFYRQAAIQSGAEKKSTLESAIDAYRHSLEIITAENHPRAYARAMNNLGIAVRDRAQFLEHGAQATSIHEAEVIFKRAEMPNSNCVFCKKSFARDSMQQCSQCKIILCYTCIEGKDICKATPNGTAGCSGIFKPLS